VRILSPRTVALMTTSQVGSLYRTPALASAWASKRRTGTGERPRGGRHVRLGGAYGTKYSVDPRGANGARSDDPAPPNAADIQQTFPAVVFQALTEQIQRPLQ